MIPLPPKLVIAPLEMWPDRCPRAAKQEYGHSTRLPGVYVIFCSMNTQDGREHFQLGMYRTITIVK